MKAMQITKTGGPEVIHAVELDRPAPGAGQVLVEVKAIGVNFIDIYYREGVYPAPLPLTLGQEAAGVVVAVGAKVERFRVGDRVGWCTVLGAYAEFAVVPEAALVAVPAKVTYEQAAASLLQGMTAQYLSTTTFPLKSRRYCAGACWRGRRGIAADADGGRGGGACHLHRVNAGESGAVASGRRAGRDLVFAGRL